MQLIRRLFGVFARTRDRPPRIALALQGGGSHGAFTWGVLDRLLEDEQIEIAAISGTSAGALNAGVLASGYARGGRAQARASLDAFWRDVASAGAGFAPYAVTGLSRAFSPYLVNPLDFNPLRDITRRHVDEAALGTGPIALFVTATAVRTGRARVFRGAELGVAALLASACLPFLFHAVEIGGQAYWDGGYSANPALAPLVELAPQHDIVLVKINPLVREGVPSSGIEIMDRASEITFNASLIAELRGVAFVSKLLREHRLSAAKYRDPRLHMIADDDGLAPFAASSKLNTDIAFLERLRELGRNAASRFLDAHRADLGRRSSLDVERAFVDERPAT